MGLVIILLILCFSRFLRMCAAGILGLMFVFWLFRHNPGIAQDFSSTLDSMIRDLRN